MTHWKLFLVCRHLSKSVHCVNVYLGQSVWCMVLMRAFQTGVGMSQCVCVWLVFGGMVKADS